MKESSIADRYVVGLATATRLILARAVVYYRLDVQQQTWETIQSRSNCLWLVGGRQRVLGFRRRCEEKDALGLAVLLKTAAWSYGRLCSDGKKCLLSRLLIVWALKDLLLGHQSFHRDDGHSGFQSSSILIPFGNLARFQTKSHEFLGLRAKVIAPAMPSSKYRKLAGRERWTS